MKALLAGLVLMMKLEKLTAVTALLLLAGMVACSDNNDSGGSGDGLGASGAVPAGQVKNFTVSTLLGDRTTAEVADQPDAQGKDVATMPFSCGASSGKCSSIYDAVTAAGQYQFIDTGAYPPITFTVASAGDASTSGTFQIQFPADLGGENVEILGDEYAPTSYCDLGTVLTATRLDGTGNLWFCVGQSSGDLDAVPGDPVPAGQVLQFTVSTLLGDRTTAEIPNQPDAQGKDVATMAFTCGSNSGKCSNIYHDVTAAGQYEFIDTGVYPSITFTVASAGDSSTSGAFQIQFPPNLSGENVEILGDSYSPDQNCTSGYVLTADPQPGAEGNLWFCVGEG